jgi:hypothetical protein
MLKNKNQNLLKTGVYGMKFGDTNTDIIINSTDRNKLRLQKDLSTLYNNLDINLDINLVTTDKALIRVARESTISFN